MPKAVLKIFKLGKEKQHMVNLKAKPFYLDDSDIEWVKSTIESMTIEEKIGQLFVPIGVSYQRDYLDHALLHYHIGGVMYRSAESRMMQETHRYLQEHSRIPLMIGANLEYGGNGIATDGLFYANQMEVAATGNPQNAYRLGKVACTQGKAVGCNWAFAPVVDIDLNWRNPITNVRTYGSSPEMVKACGLEFLKAAKEENVAVAIKHFPGDGVDEVDQHVLISVNSLTCEEWDATYGSVYGSLIEAGALTTMVGHIAMPAYQEHFAGQPSDELIPATLSPELLGGLLRGKLGFNGAIVTDSSVMVGFSCAMEREKAVPYTIAAGCDMLLFNKDIAEDYGYMMKGYQDGIISEERLEEALERILGLKAALKLHKLQPQERVPAVEALSILNDEQQNQWARECADESVTLVKNLQNLLPLDPNKYHRVLLEILGDFPSNDRVTSYFKRLLEREGFEVIVYEKEDFDHIEEVQFDVSSFKNKYDLVIYLANVENASIRVTNRLNWYTFYGNGDNVPWFVKERPTIFISLGNPYHLIDVPMMKTFINCYANNEKNMDAVVEKLMGRSPFKGTSPVDVFLGKEYTQF